MVLDLKEAKYVGIQNNVLVIIYSEENSFIFLRSIIAEELLETWPEPAQKFVKVFPYEYQRALKQLALKQPSPPKVEANGKTEENGLVDIEEAVRDIEKDKKNLEKILDKTR